MSKLETILQEEVLAEIQQLMAKAEEEAAAIVAEAKEKAEALVAAQQRKLETRKQAELHRAESAAELAVTTARVEAKGEVIATIYREVQGRLEELPQNPEYPTLLERLAEEAVAAVGEAEAIVVHPDDVPRLKGWAEGKGLAVQADDAVRLGVVAVAKGGKTRVANTLPDRLERAWEVLSAKVSQVLWA
ncbi:H+transporting two-sector ATPase E subunit [Oceanithermus profundus DSM 14977]|uniref:V-type proton ATPase subunit E n=1 Tax=Oceanithermus profundus (strain DSM 14977 / NBRC 100410 / VKM B-2274 / 506) TaxID=670487 RepID=E4U989_OCEP5|nr:V-type ATP synthase subunit E [Oceanithermus profundus]ADR36918.1 H+transporting two-sector ATPase E subunit [Oceanithermus profundus DSM 14977]